ncbi:MAG: hypothetical protein ACJ8FU_08495 [Xanthobacteraceae bacterium]
MRKASDFLRYAGESRALAATFPPGRDRDQLLEIAELWEGMARDRSAMVRLHPELDQSLGDLREPADRQGEH